MKKKDGEKDRNKRLKQKIENILSIVATRMVIDLNNYVLEKFAPAPPKHLFLAFLSSDMC